MHAVTQQLLAVLGLDEADISKSAVLPGSDSWPFAQTPSLNQLEDRACRRDAALQPVRDESRNSYADPDSCVASLESSHAFSSNHCVHAMAEAYGVSEITSALSGSIIGGLADSASAAAAIHSIRQQVDSAWSMEAVRRGVGCAKSGDYQQALECYNKALALNPNNCDACVARGAALANQKQFEAAVADFEAAVRLDPSNANAAKYLAATKQHMQVARDAGDAPGRPGHAAAAPSSDHQKQGQEQHKIHTLRAANKHGHSADSPGQDPHSHQEQPSYRHGQQSFDRVPRHHHPQQHHQSYVSPYSLQDDRDISRRRQQQLSVPDSREEAREQGYKRPHSRSRSRSRHTRRRSRSTSRSRSSSSDSSSFSTGDEGTGDGLQLLKAPTAADIKRAIEIVRSANKEGKKDRRKGSSRGKTKKRKHKRKHRKKHKS